MRTNILVVDNHLDSVVLLTRLLSRNGHSVWWASNCREAKAIASQYSIDVLLTEVVLPDGDGHRLFADLQVFNPMTKAIAYTASTYPQDLDQCLAAGFHAVLVKPVDLEDIQQTVAECIAAARPNEGSGSHPPLVSLMLM